MIALAPLTPQDLIVTALQPAEITALIQSRMRDPAHQPPVLQQQLADVVTPLLTRLLNDAEVMTLLRPAFEQALAVSLRAIGQNTALMPFIAERLETLHLSASDHARMTSEITRLTVEKLASQPLIGSFLTTLLAREVQPDQFATAFFEVAAQWRQTGVALQQINRPSNLTPALSDLRAQARAAYDAEDPERVWELLSRNEAAEQAAYDEADRLMIQMRDRLGETKRGKFALTQSQLQPERTAQLLVEILTLESPGPLFAALATNGIAGMSRVATSASPSTCKSQSTSRKPQ